MKNALIIGITGQDGSYLTELLLKKNYCVHGIVRRTSSMARSRLNHLYSNREIYNKFLFFHYSDLMDHTSLRRILLKIHPHEVYFLAGQSHVGLSFSIPEVTANEVGVSVLSLLEIIRDMTNPPKFFHASSSEIFGTPVQSPQNEETPYRPISPYGVSKTFATNMVQTYRDSYNLFLVNGIMYNHESSRRGENFVTKKICNYAAMITKNNSLKLPLGNIDVSRDWGHAIDYVYAMWLSLQNEKPGDYVLASGVSNTLQTFLELAFGFVGLSWEDFYLFDQRFVRPNESNNLVGNPEKAIKNLGWKRKFELSDIVEEMMEFELQNINLEK